jgi:O-antigen/teichoic acid export membrane protein
MRAAFWRELAAEGRARFRLEMVRRTWRYSAAMAGMSLLSTLLTQIDKLVVSRLLPLEVFAHYSLAAALAQSPPIIGMAVASAVFPRLTALVAAGRNDEMRALYHRSCQLVAAITLPFGLTLAAFAPQVLLFWTHSPATAETAGTAARLLLIGSTALTLQLVPYHLALAFGWVGLNLRLALVSLFVIVPVLWWLVAHIGLDGAGWAWCLLNVGTTPVMIVWLHRRVLAGATWPWVLSDVGRPLVATTAVLAAIWAAIHWFAHIPPSFTLALAVGAIALTAAMAASPSARSWLHPGGASVSDA